MRIPIPIIVADVIGTILLGLGLYRHFTQAQGNAPDWGGGAAIVWLMIGFGVLLILPMLIWLIKNAGKIKANS